jgi:WD40 repeat protein
MWDVQSGQPVSEPLQHEGFVTTACYSPQGRRVLTATYDGEARLWDFPEDSESVPPWLAELAEAVGGVRLNEADVFESVAAEKLFKLRESLTHAEPTDGFSSFARWFFAPKTTRAIAPGSSITVPIYVERRIKEGTETSLESAYRADPGNAEVWKLLPALKEESR